MTKVNKKDTQIIKEAKEFEKSVEVMDADDARRLARKWNTDSQSLTKDVIK